MAVKILGKRVMVRKEKIDCGGMKLTPALEEGEKNKGVIVAIGQVGLVARLRGIQEGATVVFRKHFVPDYAEGQEGQEVYVDLENILAIQTPIS